MGLIELEEQVYGALAGDSALVAMLAKGVKSIHYLQAPGDKRDRYPCLVYAPVADVPLIVGDDREIAHRVTFRFHIITLDGQYGGIYRQVHQLMEGLGLSRAMTSVYMEDGEKILIADYKIGVDSTWQQ